MNIKHAIITLAITFISPLHSFSNDEITLTTSSSDSFTLLSTRPKDDSILNAGPKPSHFTWGIDLGSGFDMSSQSLTSFDLSAGFGYRNRAIRFLGVGAGIDMMVNNSSRAYPVYGQLRTTFTSAQKFVFMEIKGGMKFLQLFNNIERKPWFASVAVGFTLASGRNFSSHITIGYSYTPLNNIILPEKSSPAKDMHEALIRLGAAF